MKKPTRKELAEMAGVSVRTLQNWQAEGINLDDIAAVLRRAAEVVNQHDPNANDEMRRARMKKINLECRRIEAAIARDSQAFVPFEVAARSHAVTWAVVRSGLSQLEGWLPEVLAGLSPEQIAKRLADAFDGLRERLADQRFWDTAETRKVVEDYEKLDADHLCRDCRQSREDCDHLHSLLQESVKAGAPSHMPAILTAPDKRKAWMRRAEAASAAYEAAVAEMQLLLACRPD